ncbi:AAA family ATPase [Candidatus Pacearchaeota archaeon]|nr:AAA family ATPase [Candidatus Pacearchaeota archaeon]
MKIKKIHIVGIYGSGKSTLARRLSKKLNIKSYDLDEIKYKRKYDKIRSVKERLKIVKDISNKKTWITEGVWLDYALDLYKKADLVIFLEIPKKILYQRILIRYFKRKFSKTRYKDHNLKTTKNILKKVKQYFHDKKYFMTLQAHKKYINEYAKKVFVIKYKKQLENLLKEIK